MLEKIAELVCLFIFLPHIRKVERRIGYKLVFRDIPPRFINGVVPWDMTALWRGFGLNIEAGANYWTIGNIVNGISTRYDRNAPQYQAWLGGYTVKLPPGSSWKPEDHLNLAIADQNSWLTHHGDPHPVSNVEGWGFTRIGDIRAGKDSGTLYESGAISHSDVGNGYGKAWPYFHLASLVMAALMNIARPGLKIKGEMMRPRRASDHSYEDLKLRAYFAIFELENNTHVILYGNGAIVPGKEGDIDTLPVIKEDLLRAMGACEIVEVEPAWISR
jgi:hypothetical protein